MSGPICKIYHQKADLKGHKLCPVNEEKFFTALLSFVACFLCFLLPTCSLALPLKWQLIILNKQRLNMVYP